MATPVHQSGLSDSSDKVVRYPQHFESIVAILFDVQDEHRYAEWLRGMEKQFPDVLIIQK